MSRYANNSGAYDPQSLEMVGLLAEAWQIDPDGEWMRAKINPAPVSRTACRLPPRT